MAKSLQEQLLGKGLIDKKKAKSIQKEQRVERKQTPKGYQKINETALQVEKVKQEKIAKDKELNRLKEIELEKKALSAQIKQLAQSNEIKRNQGEVGFQFTDNKKIKKIYVDQTQYEHLTRGLIAIVTISGSYLFVPKGVAKKIAERDESVICYLFEKQQIEQKVEEDDPYKDFKIPDDLMW